MSEAVEFLGETEVPEQSCLITTREVSPQEMPNAMNETFPRLLAAAGASSSGAPFTVYSQCNGRDFLEVMLGGGSGESPVFTIHMAAPSSSSEPADGFDIRAIAGGRHFHARAKGEYMNLPQAWKKTFQEIAARGLTIAKSRPPLEAYENDPTDTPPGDLLTSIYIPLK